MPIIASVVLDKATPSYDREYDYLLPDGARASAGCRVIVPFGRGNKGRLGFIVALHQGEPAALKSVLSVLDDSPVLNTEGLHIASVLFNTTFCSRFDSLRCQLPPGAGMRVSVGLSPIKGLEVSPLTLEAAQLYEYILTKKRLTDENLCLAAIGLPPGHPAANELVNKGFALREQLVRKRILDEKAVMARLILDTPARRLTPKQALVWDMLTQTESASVKELCYFCGVGKSVVDALAKQEAIELFEQLVTPPVLEIEAVDCPPIILSEEQGSAYDKLLPLITNGGASLLRGVTGSGKTQVFLKLIEEVLKLNKQVLVLIPEIALTPQTVSHFTARFGSRVAVLHSSLSMSERLEQHRLIKAGERDIVVGTRSAVFAPLTHPGLIVIDEEQEHTYHSESSPRYHARAVAGIRAKYHNAGLLLCSATPCAESYWNAITNRYNLVEINQRYSGNPLPEVEIIDMTTAPLAAGSTCISEALCEQLLYNLDHGEQSLLLLNRRGYSTLLKCSSCGKLIKCPHCSITMTYHSANGRLVCHCCGHSVLEPKECPNCKSAMLRYSGAGTQRAAEELQSIFPSARILRMDADSTMSRFSHQRGFEAFAKGEYDIMLGTQMVAKGLDFPNVTLAAVLCADQSLYAEDFRGFERTFSLITQAVGRCGRAQKLGRAYIQSFSPENSVLLLSKSQDYPAFMSEELAFRKAALYPPYCDLQSIVFSHKEEQTALDCAAVWAEEFKKRAEEDYPSLPIRVLGPAESSPYRAAGRFRVRLLIKCRTTPKFYALLRELWDWYYAKGQKAQLIIDTY